MEKDFSCIFTKGEDITAVSSQAVFAENIKAPVTKGDVLGSVEYFYEGKELGKVPLLAQEDIEKAGFFFCLGKILRWYAGIGEENAG
jgi:D-alanyl-D-alanine carboxypeptidase (penicillin-binding protein 5/6)